MKRILIKDIKNKIDETIKIAGWVDVRRDHGKLIFIDLRDASGKVQTVIVPKSLDNGEEVKSIRTEWVLEIEGIVKKRPENLINPELALGDIEVEAKSVKILNESKTPPFELGTDGYEVDEEVRLKYRYLDLRRERLQKNLRMRHKIIKLIRDYLSEKDFVEIDTPILTKSTPEGARDFVVPSRLHPGKFYALPQSPQQYKQLLMVAGFEKYFQIARCLRDEDTRGDRQPEFTQLDLETSFVEENDVISLNEDLLIKIIQAVYPDKKIQEIPFPRITYAEAMEKYGTDRPDLRKDKNNPNLLTFCWIVDFPFFKKTEEGDWTFTHNPFSAPKSIDELTEIWIKFSNNENVDFSKLISSQYDIVLNGLEIGGGSIRNYHSLSLINVFQILGYEKDEIINKFGHIIESFEYGAPPHGGIAWGLDRFISILQNEPNIRETIAFPKTGEGKDIMMNAPDEITKEQLEELGIEIKRSKL